MLDLFRYNSHFRDSAIRKGKGIFSYQDLQKEVQNLYKKFEDDFKEKIEATINGKINQEYLEKLTTRYIADDFKVHIDPGLQYLISQPSKTNRM